MQSSYVVPPVPDRARPVGALVGDALRRPGGRRALSVLSLVLALAGLGIFAYPLGTDLYGRYQQGHLSDTFAAPEVVKAYTERRVKIGEGLTRLKIRKIGVDVLVVQGTTPAALRAGAGHYPATPLPGEVGNVGIAGHRTTYGRPFNRLAELAPGDELQLETPLAVYTYKAVPDFAGHGNPWVVSPRDVSVVAPIAGKRMLTLTTCHPKGSAKQRLVMRFELVSQRTVTRTASG
ncbi:MAG: Membrane protein [Frankiales bacterium]|nr:Membrane protein [Frankiales bacterium]